MAQNRQRSNWFLLLLLKSLNFEIGPGHGSSSATKSNIQTAIISRDENKRHQTVNNQCWLLDDYLRGFPYPSKNQQTTNKSIRARNSTRLETLNSLSFSLFLSLSLSLSLSVLMNSKEKRVKRKATLHWNMSHTQTQRRTHTPPSKQWNKNSKTRPILQLMDRKVRASAMGDIDMTHTSRQYWIGNEMFCYLVQKAYRTFYR